MTTARSTTLSIVAWTVLLACGEEGGGVGDATPTRAMAADTAAEPGSRAHGAVAEPGTDFPAATGADPRILIRDTDLRVTPSAVLHVEELLGQVQRLQEAPAWFDEPSSFRIRVERAVTTMTGPSLAALMNEYVFAYDGAPLSDISVEIRDGLLHQEATLEKGVSIPISMTARVEVTGEGSILLVPEKMAAAGIPVTSIMELFGVELDDLLEGERARGVTVVEDFIVLDPSRLTPPPGLDGRAESVSLDGDRLHLTLVRSEGEEIPGEGLRPSMPDAPHFLFFRGGEVRFGKLTMRDTDLQIADEDPADPFDFYPGELHRQLIAGASYTMPDKGLYVEVPDYADLGR